MAVAILKKEGYCVTAATGKLQEKEFLTKLGAEDVISSDELKKTENILQYCIIRRNFPSVSFQKVMIMTLH